MNTRPAIESSSNPVALSASFNQDASCFSVGLDTGFCSKFLEFSLFFRCNLTSAASIQLRTMPASSLSRYTPLRNPFPPNAHTKQLDFNAGIGAVQMLKKANFVALIGGGKQPKFPQNKVSHERGCLARAGADKVSRWSSGMMQNRKSPYKYQSSHLFEESDYHGPISLLPCKIVFEYTNSRARRIYGQSSKPPTTH